jgi:ATP-dependent DNA ligase
MNLPISTSFETMEGLVKDELPRGDNWVYEPKWDGFRCLAFRDGEEIELMSRSQKPLARYFPDVVNAMRALNAQRFVIDGEIVIPHEDRLSFERLLMRIHPAASRVNRLAVETPAVFVAFDMLLAPEGAPMQDRPFAERRAALEEFAAGNFTDDVRISPETRDVTVAETWLNDSSDGLDGVMAKKLDLTYRSGERAMIKVKRMRTADCVVIGFRYAAKKRVLGSLLLGLYDDNGVMHHIGHTSSFSDAEKAALTPELEKLAADAGFTGHGESLGTAPGGPSRWNKRENDDWVPLPPRLIAEVRYDHFSEGRFRHATGFLRWRPDKDAADCTFDQIETEGRSTRALLTDGGGA